MTTPELIQFIRSELNNRVSKESIVSRLKSQGWPEADINEGFNIVAPVVQPVRPVAQPVATTSPSVAVVSPNAPAIEKVLPTSPSADISASTETHVSTQQTLPTEQVSIESVSVDNGHPRIRKMLKFGLLVGVLVVCGGVAAYAAGYIIPLEKIFSQSIGATKDIKASTFDAHVSVDLSGVTSLQDMTKLLPGLAPVVTFDSKGSYDVHDEKKPKSAVVSTVQSGTIQATIETRTLDGSLYLNMLKAPDLGFLSLKPFENKWISFNPEKDLNALDGGLPLSVNPKGFSSLTDEQKKHIEDMTRKAHLVTITKKHLPEIIDGTPSFHFDFDLDKAGTIAYLKELTMYLATIDSTVGSMRVIPDDAGFAKMFDAVKDFHGEAWVGIFDQLPRKVTIDFSAGNPDNAGDGKAKISAVLLYSDWNKSVTVEAPTKSSTIEELMSSIANGEIPMEGSALENAESKGKDAQIKSTLSNMRAQAELFYDSNNNSYKGFCTSKKNAGGVNGAYALAITLPANTVYKCNDKATEWAAQAGLSDPNKSYCVDSTGVVAERPDAGVLKTSLCARS